MPRYLLIPADTEDPSTPRQVELPQALLPENHVTSAPLQPTSTREPENVHGKPIFASTKQIAPLKNVSAKQSQARGQQTPTSPSTITSRYKKKKKLNSRLWNVTERVLPLVEDRSKALRLMRFLRKHEIQMTHNGELSFKGRIYHGANLEELFCDAVNGARRRLPSNYVIFYDILKKLNVNLGLFSPKRIRLLR